MMIVSFTVSVYAVEISGPNYHAPDGNDYFIGHNFSGVKITDEILDGYDSLTFKVENTTNQSWIWISIPNSMPIQDGQTMPAIIKFNGQTVAVNYDKYACSYGKNFVITEPSVIEIDFLYDEKNLDAYHYAILNKECDNSQKTKLGDNSPPKIHQSDNLQNYEEQSTFQIGLVLLLVLMPLGMLIIYLVKKDKIWNF